MIISRPCTLFADRVCTPCTKCQAFEDTGTYEAKACSSRSDTVCANCTRCKPVSSIYNASNASDVAFYPRWKKDARRGEYIFTSCGDGSDTVCGKCQESCPSHFHMYTQVSAAMMMMMRHAYVILSSFIT